MTISICVKKTSNKIQHSFKTLNQLEIKNFLNLVKSIYDQPTANNTLINERMNVFSYDQERGNDAHSCHFHSTL